jgi:hypothetical protein
MVVSLARVRSSDFQLQAFNAAQKPRRWFWPGHVGTVIEHSPWARDGITRAVRQAFPLSKARRHLFQVVRLVRARGKYWEAPSTPFYELPRDTS